MRYTNYDILDDLDALTTKTQSVVDTEDDQKDYLDV